MPGPYATEREAKDDAQDVLALSPVGTRWDEGNVEKIRTACEDAGVEWGAYDEMIARWLASWEPGAVQVIVGWITRARAR